MKFSIDYVCLSFCRKFSDKTSWLISVTVTLEKEFLFQEGFRYKYYTDYDSVACLATCEDYFDETCKPSFRKLKLTKEELSRGKNKFYSIC